MITSKGLKKFIRLTILSIAAILYWKGISGLADQFLFPDNEVLSSIAALIIAVVIVYFGRYSFKEIREA